MIKICQCCGAILKNELSSCESCGARFSLNSPSSMPSLNELKVPEKIETENDPFLVEHILVNRIFAKVEETASNEAVVEKTSNRPGPGKRSNAVSISVSNSTIARETDCSDARDPYDFFDSMNNAIENVTPLAPLRKYPKEENVIRNHPASQNIQTPDSQKETSDLKREDSLVLRVPRKLISLVFATLLVGVVALLAVLLIKPEKTENTQKPLNKPVIAETNNSVIGHRGDILRKKNKAVLVETKEILNGDWEVTYRSHDVVDTATITQTKDKFSGHGKAFYADNTIHDFDIYDGVITDKGLVTFTKRFRSLARQNGAPVHPINFEGRIESTNETLSFSGKFTTQVTIGHFNNKKTALSEGPFKAILVKSYLPNAESAPVLKFDLNSISQEQKYFLIALGILGFCVILIMVSLKLFSPSGILNRWEKEKYIPSQYKSQHNEKLRQFAKGLKAGSLPLGRRCEWNWWWPFTAKNLAMPPEERSLNPNVLVLGSSKKGKTRLMASMAMQDIISGDRAVVIIDPDGSLSDLTIHKIASSSKLKQHADRVVIIDPTEEGNEIHSFNPLEYPDDGNLQSAANSIVHGFKAMYTEPPGVQSQWNEQTANILRNAALLLMLNNRTLVDMPNLLQDNDFRDLMLEKIEQHKDKRSEFIVILDTWQQYKKLARTEQWINWVEPILNRIGPSLGDGRVRRIIDKPVSSLNLKRIIEEKKVLIVRAPKGELDKSANLLGSLLVTGIQKAALSLFKKEPSNQNPVSIYLEELDSYIEKDTLEKISNQSQRYQIGCIGSLKTLQHLPEDFKSSLTVNMGLLAAFSLQQKDAEILGKQIFRVDGRKTKFKTFTNFINPINTSPQFELIMDEEKLNMDRLAGLSDRTYYCYRTGTEAGVFKLLAPDFEDVELQKLNQDLLDKMWSV